MAFALLSRSSNKPQGSVKPVPKQKFARTQHSADSRFGFAKPVLQPPTAALPAASVIQTKLNVGERNDELEQEADPLAELTENGGGSILPAAVAQSRSPVGSLQRLYGNQAVLQMRNGFGGPPALSAPLRPSQGGILQRKCACGGAAGISGECEESSKKKRLGLQTKLKISEPGDIYEQEADRVADQVLATPAHHAVSGAPPRIQRFSGQSNEHMDAAPASVDQALASPGRPLEPALRQDMEQRFGHDFSRVRVHSGAAAEQSARDVSAHAYTVGYNMVFGAGQLAPGSQEGRRLLAHELTHVVQQSGGDDIPAGLNDVTRGPFFGGQQGATIADEGEKHIPRRPTTASVVALQRNLKDDLANEIAHDLNDYVAKNPLPYKHVIKGVRSQEANELDDNVAAAFTELQSLAQLEKFAATQEGRAMLDVLYNAMITGTVSPFESLQSERILFAKWKWVPTEVYKTAQLRDPAVVSPVERAEDLKAGKIAQDLNDDVAKNLYRDVIKKVTLDPHIEDNVASHFIVLQSPDRLEKFAANNEGRAMLDVLYEALITGEVTAFERLQAERILNAKAKQIPPIPPKEYLAQLEQEGQYILPLRMQKTLRSAYAIFEATLQPNGKVKVRYDDVIHFWNSDMFKEDFKHLPPYRVASTGFELNPDEMVRLKLYDQGEKLVPVPALALIDYANQAKRQSVSVGVAAFQAGLFLGFGGLGAFSGARVSALAAEVEAGQASVTALTLAKGLLWADRVTMALPIVSMVVNEHREWILDKLPHAGPVLLGVLDQANRITEYYGWARMGVEGARYLKSKLGSALTEWRAEAATRKGLSSSEQKIVKGVDNEIEIILDDLSRAETEAGLAAVKFVEKNPNVIKGKPGAREATVGGHKVVEVKDPKTGVIRCKYRSDGGAEVPCPEQWSQEPQVKPSEASELPKPAVPTEPPKPAVPTEAPKVIEPPREAPKLSEAPKKVERPAKVAGETAPPSEELAPKARPASTGPGASPEERIRQLADENQGLSNEAKAAEPKVSEAQRNLEKLNREADKLANELSGTKAVTKEAVKRNPDLKGEHDRVKELRKLAKETEKQRVSAAGEYARLKSSQDARYSRIRDNKAEIERQRRPELTLPPTPRGRANELRVLKEEGLLGPKKSFTAFDPVKREWATTIPDGMRPNGRTVDVKDVAKLSETQQLRLQREVSRRSGQKAEIITGRKTVVPPEMERTYLITKRPDLGPQ